MNRLASSPSRRASASAPGQTTTGPRTARQLTARLRKLKLSRKNRTVSARANIKRRAALTRSGRAQILEKTARRCHICGGKIRGNDWHADHVLAHSVGGLHSTANYLPAHSLCNNYRWHYSEKEFQLILKLGVWLANEIRHESPLGTEAAARFVRKEQRRAARCHT